MSPWAGSSWNGRHQAKRRIESSELGSLFDCVSVPFSRWALVGQTLTKAECTCRSGALQPKSLMQRKKILLDIQPKGRDLAGPGSATGAVGPVLQGAQVAPERRVVVPDLSERIDRDGRDRCSSGQYAGELEWQGRSRIESFFEHPG